MDRLAHLHGRAVVTAQSPDRQAAAMRAARAPYKAAAASMRYPTDPDAAENINLRDLVEQAVTAKLAQMRATGCHQTPTTILGNPEQ